METFKIGRVNPNLITTINPRKFVYLAVFRRLNFLLNYLEEKTEIDLAVFVRAYLNLIAPPIRQEDLQKALPEDIFDAAELSGLAKYPALEKASWFYYLHLLGLNPEEAVNAEIRIPVLTMMKTYLYPRYYQVQTLFDILPDKKRAVEIMKAFTDAYYHFVKEAIPQYDDLESQWKDAIPDDLTGDNGGWIVTASKVVDGKYIWRNDNCPMVDALAALPDKEIVYLVCCYGDFESIKVRNENFVMTRTKTIAEGDPFCDKVFHDSRVSDMVHVET